MADNVTLPGTGSVVATDDIGGFQHQRVKLIYGSDGVNSGDVSATNPFPISMNASTFVFSTNNSSSVELASLATFTGTIETALNQPAISLLLTSDQPITLTVKQYIDVAGTYAAPNIVYYIAANTGFSASFPLNGNYIQVTAKNTGLSTTTTFELNTAYGTIDSSDGSGRLPISKADCIPLLTQTMSAAGVSTTMDTVGYGAIVVQLTGTWQGSGYFEGSNDNLSWDSVLTFSRDSLSLQDIVNSNGLYTVRPSGRYLRYTVTNITGSCIITALGRAAEGIAASDLLSLAMDRNNNTPLQVQLNGTKQDAQGGLMLADGSIVLTGSGTSTTVPMGIIDTLGYQSLAIQVGGGSGSVRLDMSNDGAVWFAGGMAFVQSATASTGYSQGAVAFTAANPAYITISAAYRYVRVVLSAFTSGTPNYIAYLRQSALSMGTVGNATTNITQIGTVGLAAEDAATSSPPVIVGGVVRTAIAPSTLVSGDAIRPTFSASAALITESHAVRELTWSYAAAASGIANTTTAVTIKAAVASQRGNITSIQIQHEPLGAATEFAIRDGAAGTVLWRIKLPVTTAEGGMQFTFDPPIAQAAVNTLLEVVTLTASVTGAVYFNAQGFMSN